MKPYWSQWNIKFIKTLVKNYKKKFKSRSLKSLIADRKHISDINAIIKKNSISETL